MLQFFHRGTSNALNKTRYESRNGSRTGEDMAGSAQQASMGGTSAHNMLPSTRVMQPQGRRGTMTASSILCRNCQAWSLANCIACQAWMPSARALLPHPAAEARTTRLAMSTVLLRAVIHGLRPCSSLWSVIHSLCPCSSLRSIARPALAIAELQHRLQRRLWQQQAAYQRQRQAVQ